MGFSVVISFLGNRLLVGDGNACAKMYNAPAELLYSVH